MKVLLVGEYSNLHNTIKKGLSKLNVEAFIIGEKSGYKNFYVDYDITPKITYFFFPKNPKFFLFRKIHTGFCKLERAIRFLFFFRKIKKYDIIQFINERSIGTFSLLEYWFLKKIFGFHKKIFLLSTWVDYSTMKYYLENRDFTSIIQPYFKNEKLKSHYSYAFYYITKRHYKIYKLFLEYSEGIITTDLDYHFAWKGEDKYLGMIPNPINTDEIDYLPINQIEFPINIFLGINRHSYIEKGIWYFENALKSIKIKYGEKVNSVISEDLPYQEYINSYNFCHIFLDQVFSKDQGYNALEAMAKGKVVFTGADFSFLGHYRLSEDEVAINVLPDVDEIVRKLSFFIENPQKIIRVGRNARDFIEKYHCYINQTSRYLNIWSKK